MKFLLTTIIAAFSFHALSAQDEKAKNELEQLSWDWMNAWRAKDTVLLQKLMAPEYRLLALINGELVSINRERWLKTVPLYIPKSIRYTNFDIRIYGNTAIVQSLFDQEATLNGQDRSGTFQITDVWVKNKSGWQVVHRHTTLKPKPQ
jgi:ketosteroid isomerase-like protein